MKEQERFIVGGVAFDEFGDAVGRASLLASGRPGPVSIEREFEGNRVPYCDVQSWRGADALRQLEAMRARAASGESEFWSPGCGFHDGAFSS